MVMKTWSEVLAHLNIHLVDLPWNVTAKSALQELRKQFGDSFSKLYDLSLDEVVELYNGRGITLQLEALGSALQRVGLRLCHLAIQPSSYKLFVTDSVNTRSFQEMWKGLITRRQFFDNIETISLRSTDMSKPDNEIVIPMQSVQLINNDMRGFKRVRRHFFGDDVAQVDSFLLIQVLASGADDVQPLPPQIIAYDLRSWPLVPYPTTLSYNRNNIEPYSIEFTTTAGEYYNFEGPDISSLHAPYKVLDDECCNDSVDDTIISIDGKCVKNYPNIIGAVPVLSFGSKVIYYYKDDPVTVNGLSVDSEQRKRRLDEESILLCWDSETDVYSIQRIPNFRALIRNDSIKLYKRTWVMIPEAFSDSSYALRFWNPITNQCLRLKQKLLGSYNICQYIKTPNSDDWLFLMNDGRICRFDVDLIDYLNQQRGSEIKIEGWCEETKRSFDGFPLDRDRPGALLLRRRRLAEADDRMKIMFSNMVELDIAIKE